MNFTQLLRKTSPYILLVVAAFAVMGLVGYYSSNNLIKNQTEENIDHLLGIAEMNIAEGLARSDLQLLNAYHSIGRMLDRGVNFSTVVNYMEETSLWMNQDPESTPGFMGLYAYVNGVHLDGNAFSPGDDWDLESRPWYQLAQTLGPGETGCTTPYIDARTGKPVITFVRNLYGQRGDYYGILALDIDLVWFSEQYVQGMSLRGYGIVLNEGMKVVCHPDETRLGRNLDELSYDYAMTASLLRQNGRIWNRHITDLDGEPVMVFFRPILNGWYAGLVMSLSGYYEDIYELQINPVFIGLIMILLLSILLLRINAAQIHSDEISAYKSAFLAQMSHEVRTPMNTVMGMSELALREQDPSRILEYVAGIKRATHSLLSIVNDILDISRIESGTLQITPVSYFFASLLNDVIGMIRVQAMEKPVVFMAHADSWIPNALVGDEARLKQIMINLLSNAVKYTHKGFISLDIQGTIQDRKTILLTIKVSDSGVGIRKEDRSTLFDNFVRLDMEKNRGIEGTGLGLVITRNLCRAMGGDVTVQSEYGKGSVFTATLLQSFEEDTEIARVDNPLEKRVLCFEERDNYAASILRTLEDLGVPAKRCAGREEFLRELDRGGYQFAFVTAGIVAETADRIKSGFLPTTPVLLANLGEMVSWQRIPMLTMPVYAVPAANVLNNRSVFDQRKRQTVRFIIPDVRILVVDDIATNVKVAQGLLGLYQPVIDTCNDGHTAVDLVRKHHYDLVFLDHMMPGMDGIETAGAIRALKEDRFQSLPIVALTANAIFGMREMFLKNGFNDYLTKPIEIAKLEEILSRWIPQEKQIRVSSLQKEEAEGFEVTAGRVPSGAGGAGALVFDMTIDPDGSVPIEGVDIMEGMNLTGSSNWAMYCDILSLYCQDTTRRMGGLRILPDAGSLHEFCTEIHALKGASASIGAVEAARLAAEIETAGKSGDLSEVEARLEPFRLELEALVARIGKALVLRP